MTLYGAHLMELIPKFNMLWLITVLTVINRIFFLIEETSLELQQQKDPCKIKKFKKRETKVRLQSTCLNKKRRRQAL